MAESILIDMSNSLLGKVTSYSCQEAYLAYGVKDNLQSFKESLTNVRGYLRDAESKKDKSHALREWLKQIQDICIVAEDIFDTFELQDKRKQIVESSGSIRKKVSHLFSSSNPIVCLPRMGHQIKDITERLDMKAAEGKTHGLTSIPEPRMAHQIKDIWERETTYPGVNVSSVIGRDDDKEKIINLLVPPFPQGGNDGDKSMCVIPIVGMGGLGKTTLAKLVFNDKRVDQNFQLKMWVCVSLNFDIKQIIIKIINAASSSAPLTTLTPQENINNLDIGQLTHRMQQILSGQKFLLVLDDVWNQDHEKWIQLEDLINVGTPGSKILVTTRSKSVAWMMGNVPSYELKGLSPEECLSLFVKCAFKEGEEKRYPILKKIGQEIVEKCHGIPLAVKTLGSSLFSDINISKLEFVRDSEMWNLEQKKDGVLPALKVSYDQMPSILRQCFTFFSLYPKDYIFDGCTLCNLWVALGLVQSRNESEKLEHVARKYIDELHSRSFIQDVRDFGANCYFKVHHLIHDLAVYVAKEDFVVVDSQTQNIPQQARHLSFVEDESFGHALLPESRSVRSIQCQSVLNTWVSRYTLLRYLDLSDSSFEIVPNSIAKLEHLRFLDLSRNCKIRTLPNSISKLLLLEVLLLSGCTELESLPKGLGKLINLRRLIVTSKQCMLPHDEFASLKNLQTLSFHYCGNLKFLFKLPLPSIEELYFESCGSLKCLHLYMFPKLETLYIRDCQMLNLSLDNENSIQKLRMKHLYLCDFLKLQTLPRWIECAVDTLETFAISNIPNLKMLPEYLSTMTRLKRIYIVRCFQLILTLPSDLHCLTALEDLGIFDIKNIYIEEGEEDEDEEEPSNLEVAR